jgi:hypothetical protein
LDDQAEERYSRWVLNSLGTSSRTRADGVKVMNTDARIIARFFGICNTSYLAGNNTANWPARLATMFGEIMDMPHTDGYMYYPTERTNIQVTLSNDAGTLRCTVPAGKEFYDLNETRIESVNAPSNVPRFATRWVIYDSATSFRLATSLQNAIDDIAVSYVEGDGVVVDMYNIQAASVKGYMQANLMDACIRYCREVAPSSTADLLAFSDGIDPYFFDNGYDPTFFTDRWGTGQHAGGLQYVVYGPPGWSGDVEVSSSAPGFAQIHAYIFAWRYEQNSDPDDKERAQLCTRAGMSLNGSYTDVGMATGYFNSWALTATGIYD